MRGLTIDMSGPSVDNQATRLILLASWQGMLLKSISMRLSDRWRSRFSLAESKPEKFNEAGTHCC